MAQKWFLKSPNLPHLYVVNSAVGYGCSNRTDDVMLVQFLLREVLGANNKRPLGKLLTVDGSFGPFTHYWMLFFQSIADQNSRSIDFKGIAEPAAGLKITLFSQGGMVGHLNGFFRNAFPERWKHLEKDPSVPALLQKAMIDNNDSETRAAVKAGTL